MSRDPYRSSANDLGRGGTRWDSERLTVERDRGDRFGGEHDRFEERITHSGPPPRSRSRHRELSVDEEYDRRSSRGFEEDRVHERIQYDERDEPRYARAPVRPARASVTIEKEREQEYYTSPPRNMPRPGLIRRQSSLDTFDRKPHPFYERERYGPPALRDDHRSIVPVPRVQAPSPPRRYVERDYEEVKIRDSDYYEDEYKVVPERVREREIVRTRRRSRSRSRSRSSSSSSSSSVFIRAKRVEMPKKGKTRIPARMVSVKAIIELGYPYEMEGETVVIQKALGKEHIDEVIKRSETYKSVERIEMTGGRYGGTDVIEETSRSIVMIEPPSHRPREEVVERLTVERREVSPHRGHISRSRSVGRAPLIVEARHGEYVERSNNIPIGPLVLLQNDRRGHRTNKEVEIIRREEVDDGPVVLYQREEVNEPDVVVRIEKNKKGSKPRAIRAMMKTLM